MYFFLYKTISITSHLSEWELRGSPFVLLAEMLWKWMCAEAFKGAVNVHTLSMFTQILLLTFITLGTCAEYILIPSHIQYLLLLLKIKDFSVSKAWGKRGIYSSYAHYSTVIHCFFAYHSFLESWHQSIGSVMIRLTLEQIEIWTLLKGPTVASCLIYL